MIVRFDVVAKLIYISLWNGLHVWLIFWIACVVDVLHLICDHMCGWISLVFNFFGIPWFSISVPLCVVYVRWYFLSLIKSYVEPGIKPGLNRDHTDSYLQRWSFWKIGCPYASHRLYSRDFERRNSPKKRLHRARFAPRSVTPGGWRYTYTRWARVVGKFGKNRVLVSMCVLTYGCVF